MPIDLDIPPAWESTGVRRVITSDGTMLKGRMVIELPDTINAVDEGPTPTRPARTRLEFVTTKLGIDPDGTGGWNIGVTTGGWITVLSDAFGFRVRNSDGSGYSFEVANNVDTTTVRGVLQNIDGVTSDAMIIMGDTGSPLVSLGTSAVALQCVSGTLKVTQHAAPTVTGSRGGNAALASLLTTLANLGLIVNSTTA